MIETSCSTNGKRKGSKTQNGDSAYGPKKIIVILDAAAVQSGGDLERALGLPLGPVNSIVGSDDC